MKVLLLNGSPNRAGSTATALAEVEGALHKEGIETVWFHLGKKAVHGCTACGYCDDHDACVFDDDGANECMQLLREADGVVVGSPVYYAGPNGALCALLDRVFYVAGNEFAGKPATCLAACRRGGSSATLDRLTKYFTISNMPVVASHYWNMVHGQSAEQVRQDAEGMQVMRQLGANFAWMLRAFKEAGPPPALGEEKVWTNFIR